VKYYDNYGQSESCYDACELWHSLLQYTLLVSELIWKSVLAIVHIPKICGNIKVYIRVTYTHERTSLIGRGEGHLKVCSNFYEIILMEWNDVNLTYVVLYLHDLCSFFLEFARISING
jgi:hypothetical protein